jgi:hypothetical protein
LDEYLKFCQGENTIGFTLTPSSGPYRLSIHFMASTSLIVPRYFLMLDCISIGPVGKQGSLAGFQVGEEIYGFR